MKNGYLLIICLGTIFTIFCCSSDIDTIDVLSSRNTVLAMDIHVNSPIAKIIHGTIDSVAHTIYFSLGFYDEGFSNINFKAASGASAVVSEWNFDVPLKVITKAEDGTETTYDVLFVRSKVSIASADYTDITPLEQITLNGKNLISSYLKAELVRNDLVIPLGISENNLENGKISLTIPARTEVGFHKLRVWHRKLNSNVFEAEPIVFPTDIQLQFTNTLPYISDFSKSTQTTINGKTFYIGINTVLLGQVSGADIKDNSKAFFVGGGVEYELIVTNGSTSEFNTYGKLFCQVPSTVPNGQYTLKVIYKNSTTLNNSATTNYPW